MEYLLGFAIAALIGLTGVGGGSITAPVLTLFLGVPPAVSVGTALLFTAIVKLMAAPLYLARRQVNFRILALLLAGGLPGVLGGSYVLARMASTSRKGPLLAILGAIILLMALLNLYRLLSPRPAAPARDRSRWLPYIALPIGAEVGFSSAGAGALGSLVLLAITPLTAAQVVGTDLFFGLCVSLVGSGFQLSAGNYDSSILTRLVIGGLVGAVAGTYLAAI